MEIDAFLQQNWYRYEKLPILQIGRRIVIDNILTNCIREISPIKANSIAAGKAVKLQKPILL